MPTVLDIIRRLCPNGTNDLPFFREPNWTWFPRWPPDTFAVAATVANLSGCYSRPRFTKRGCPGYFFSIGLLGGISDLGSKWGEFPDSANPGRNRALGNNDFLALTSLWRTLCDGGDIKSQGAAASSWQNAAMKLMLIADYASRGMGFDVRRPLADLVLRQHALLLHRRPHNKLPYIPRSLCKMVPPDEVCVQPKTKTPQAGCTLRSFSHHLALLRSAQEVTTTWAIPTGLERAGPDGPTARPLNLLVVPFPFRIDGSCFSPRGQVFAEYGPSGEERARKKWRFFAMEQRWLQRKTGKAKVTAKDLKDFLLPLIEEAGREVTGVDAVILPELALDLRRAKQVARFLYQETNLEFFISGVVDQRSGIRNSVYGSIFSRARRSSWEWTQSKHHRWKLEDSQICRYHLGERLHCKDDWWEEIDIDDRQCGFWVYRPGASLVTLVCEDLARIDPVQQVIRSVGPNLVIPLLMDGPQRGDRWSARYATVLADDPGSAVLSITSLGLIKRSVMPGEAEPSEIALWKGGEGRVKVLKLPKDRHALLVTLATESETQYTLDGRSDEGQTRTLYLSAVHGIKHPQLPGWVQV
jgi:hypothetical protein